MQLHLFISGFVQGVGFRQFIKSHAKKLGLTGWTKNLSDGRVEVVAQGDGGNLEKLVGLCKKGPMLSEVKDIQANYEEPHEYFSEFVAVS